MKIAVSGKGGVGKTTIVALFADYLAKKGKSVWLVDADTSLSLGQACGLNRNEIPEPLITREDLLLERIYPSNSAIMDLNPRVSDLPETLKISLPFEDGKNENAKGEKHLLVMGAVQSANSGCACASNALLKALLAHLVLEREEWVLVDVEAGVEHLGRGTLAHIDYLLVISEASMRALETAAEVGRMGKELGLKKQILILNQAENEICTQIPLLEHLPEKCLAMPTLHSLKQRQLFSPSVLNLTEDAKIIESFFDTLHLHITK